MSGLCAALLLGVTRATEPVSTRAEAAASQPPFRLFVAWLDAFNSGDPKRYARFLERKFPFRGSALGDDLALRELTGGYELRKVERISAIQVTGWLRERHSDKPVEFEFTLELYLPAESLGRPPAARPYRIVSLDLRGGNAPPTLASA